MKTSLIAISVFVLLFSITSSCGQTQNTASGDPYTYRREDPNGIGKWYMGREIAHVMGYQGMSWLERSEREAEEETSKLIDFMDIQPDDTIADIGAGSGYHVFKIAPKASEGLIYAVDIQPEMLGAIRDKAASLGTENIQLIQGEIKTTNLPENSVDKVLMVDVYHEFSHPIEMIQSIKKALRANGEIYLIEYRGEDSSVPIKRLHKMTEAQAVKEMEAAGFRLKQNKKGLPWQHCMIFVKE